MSSALDAITIPVSLTVLTATRGNASKRLISAWSDGAPVLDPAHSLWIAEGHVEHVQVAGLAGLQDLLSRINAKQALVHGIPPGSSPGDVFKLVVAEKYTGAPGTIARTLEHFSYPPDRCLFMFDYDVDPTAQVQISSAAELMALLTGVLPELEDIGYLTTTSTRSAIRSKDAPDAWLVEPRGMHVYFLATGDVARFRDLLKVKLWCAGLGFCKLATTNKDTGVAALLERALVDLTVFSPERLDYVAGALIAKTAPFYQDRPPPELHAGIVLNLDAMPDVTDAERQDYEKRLEAAQDALRPGQRETVRQTIARQTPPLSDQEQEQEITRRLTLAARGELMPEHTLYFLKTPITAQELSTKAGKALDGKRLRDPQEPDYRDGASQAVFHWRGGDWRIVSWAHGVQKTYQRTRAVNDVLDQEAMLDELARLSPLAYDQCREEKATLLGIRVKTLDAEVTARRAAGAAAASAPDTTTPVPPEPWTEVVHGAQLLDAIADTYRQYAILPTGAPDALALWTLNTYVFDAADVNPRLQLTSPLMRCGKTRVLETLSLLVSKPLPASNVSPSAIFRVIEQSSPTLLIDEADTFAKDNEELRGLLNSGHTRRSAYVLRSVPAENNKWEAKRFSTWAPMALAGIGRLFPTLEDRSIRIVLKRKLPTEKVSRLPLREDAEPFATLRRQCTRWGHDHLNTLRDADPSPPPGLHDRAADNWRPLLAIAEAVGGEWPGRITAAIASLTATDGDNEGLGVLLLKDMQHVFAEQKTPAISSEDLVQQLHGMEDRPWSEYGKEPKPISKAQIARLLRPFDIRPKNVRVGNAIPKGYALDACQDVFQRYIACATPPFENATPLQTNNDAAKHDFQSATNTANVAVRKSQISAPILACSGVADWNGGVARNTHINGSLSSGVVTPGVLRESTTPGIPLAYSTPSGQRLPCRVCGGSERWQDGNTWRCVTCWPSGTP